MIERVLIFSDSLAAPRNKGKDQVLPYEETWPYLLREAYPSLKVAQVSIGSATTEEILYQTQYWTGYNPDLVICQFGLCDCLPRALRLWEIELIKLFPKADQLHQWIIRNSERFRKLRKITRTDMQTFSERARDINKLFPKVFWISILIDKQVPPLRFPRCIELVNQYNKILLDLFESGFIDARDYLENNVYMPDGLHLNSKGHAQILNLLCSNLFEDGRQ